MVKAACASFSPGSSRRTATAAKLATAAISTTTSAAARAGSSRTACLAVVGASIGQIVIHIQATNTAAPIIQPSDTL